MIAPEVWRIDSISMTPITGPTVLSTTGQGAIYLAGNGIYRSADNGRTWINVSSGLPVMAIGAMGFHPDGWVYAGTLGGSVVRSTLKETGSDVSTVRRPDAGLEGVTLEVVQGAVGERISVRYSLPASGTVRLDLISMRGERIATMVGGEVLSAGMHSAEIDRSGLPAGTYFCRLTVDGASRVVKLAYLP
jgi:hypothetical protein